MRKLAVVCIFFLPSFLTFSQTRTNPPEAVVSRPKLVVGITIDQMRWDYLYRYYDRFAANGGFKRFLKQGFSCENTFIPYTPTVTACGHTCIYTGSVPAIHGIVGNDWLDNLTLKSMYCTQDDGVKTVGASNANGQMSPKNLLTTTVCDELKLATNFRSKVIGIAIKDRGGILPAGHSADAAYWYDASTGNWITSTYYMNDLPQWVKDFNAKKLADTFYQRGWNTLYPVNTYVQSTADDKPYERNVFGTTQKTFPYDLKSFIGTNYGMISNTPFGNTITTELSKAAITNEQLGADNITDFLAVSYSTPDYIGHSYGPNSIEEEDNYLRLDKDLGDLLNFLDGKVGKGQYLVFLSADHAVAHAPGFMQENKLPGKVAGTTWTGEMKKQLAAKFGSDRIVRGSANHQIYLDHPLIDSLKLNMVEIEDWMISFIEKQEGIARAFSLHRLSGATLNGTVKSMVANGYYPKRSGDIQFILLPGWIEGGTTGTTHGAWYPYDSHIPLLFYGWGIKQGKTNRETYMTDIAPTIAAFLHIQMPSGSVGKVIEEARK